MAILKPTDDEIERVRTILETAPCSVGISDTTTLDTAIKQLVDFAWAVIEGNDFARLLEDVTQPNKQSN